MTDNAFPISVFHDSVDLQCMHYFVKFKLKIDDSLDVFAVHGVGGMGMPPPPMGGVPPPGMMGRGMPPPGMGRGVGGGY